MKKGQGRSFWIIVTAVIALVVVVLVILWFRESGEKAFTDVGGRIDSLKDCDNDGSANMFDKCPCDPVKTDLEEGELCGGAGSEAIRNCPEGCP